ncbi:DNA (cytosine-5)-methyltransferase 3A-like [Ptychodera flava]|uniref:DNA (cytosine-5)-methyltransferase 3A-like n=1 Tax=Ptychodera flava TaxID=63121 RepID=UPI00396AAD0C
MFRHVKFVSDMESGRSKQVKKKAAKHESHPFTAGKQRKRIKRLKSKSINEGKKRLQQTYKYLPPKMAGLQNTQQTAAEASCTDNPGTNMMAVGTHASTVKECPGGMSFFKAKRRQKRKRSLHGNACVVQSAAKKWSDVQQTRDQFHEFIERMPSQLSRRQQHVGCVQQPRHSMAKEKRSVSKNVRAGYGGTAKYRQWMSTEQQQKDVVQKSLVSSKDALEKRQSGSNSHFPDQDLISGKGRKVCPPAGSVCDGDLLCSENMISETDTERSDVESKDGENCNRKRYLELVEHLTTGLQDDSLWCTSTPDRDRYTGKVGDDEFEAGDSISEDDESTTERHVKTYKSQESKAEMVVLMGVQEDGESSDQDFDLIDGSVIEVPGAKENISFDRDIGDMGNSEVHGTFAPIDGIDETRSKNCRQGHQEIANDGEQVCEDLMSDIFSMASGPEDAVTVSEQAFWNMEPSGIEVIDGQDDNNNDIIFTEELANLSAEVPSDGPQSSLNDLFFVSGLDQASNSDQQNQIQKHTTDADRSDLEIGDISEREVGDTDFVVMKTAYPTGPAVENKVSTPSGLEATDSIDGKPNEEGKTEQKRPGGHGTFEGQGSLRGLSAWQLCLRQTVKKVDKFQAGGKKLHKKPRKQKRERQGSSKSVIKAKRSKLKIAIKAKQSKLKIRPDKEEPKATGDIEKQEFGEGQLVWGKLKHYPWWPGKIISPSYANHKPAKAHQRWIFWYGDAKISLIDVNCLKQFRNFQDNFHEVSFSRMKTYKTAVHEALKVAADRAFQTSLNEQGMGPSSDPHDEIRNLKKKDCGELISWAKDNFQPEGHESIEPSNDDKLQACNLDSAEDSDGIEDEQLKEKVQRMKNVRETRITEVREGKKKIQDVCIVCGDESLIVAQHPLFEGGLCETCRVDYLHSFFLYDDDGFQSFCSVCSEGSEVLLCSDSTCSRIFCTSCLDVLIGPGTSDKEEQIEGWLCYMCRSGSEHGLLRRQDNWNSRLHEMMLADIDSANSPNRYIFPIPLRHDRRPIRVLSLFDGISPVAVILKKLGIKVDCFYASESDSSAVVIARAREPNICHVQGIRDITEENLAEWGPFDLLLAGCRFSNLRSTKTKPKDYDPDRFALKPSVQRVLEFHRIFKALTGNRDVSKPFFWLFESEADIDKEDELSVSKLLQVESMAFDSNDVSALIGFRYFWGNLPGMNRPGFWKKNYSETVQDFLSGDYDRQAQYDHIETIIPKASARKNRKMDLPVKMGDEYDELWTTEIEKLLGFPEHYTNVTDLEQSKKQRLLCECWSLRMVKHLLAPLKEYFACDS